MDKRETETEISSGEVSSSSLDAIDVSSDEEFIDMENFDPSLFIPDIILELGDTPIFTDNDQVTGSPDKYKETSSAFSNCKLKTKQPEVVSLMSAITMKENELRKKSYGSDNPVQYTKIHCTACNDHLGSALSETRNRLVHPLLRVLVCRECREFYGSGHFEKEEDGSEIYCRWCGQGGQVMCCSKCEFVFCMTCIRFNLGRKKLNEIKSNDEWTCFSCNPLQIIELRSHCAEFMDYAQKERLRIANLANAQSLMRTDYSKCCLKTNNASIEKKKKKSDSSMDPSYDPYKKNLPNKNTKISVERKLVQANTLHKYLTNTTNEPKPVSQSVKNPSGNLGGGVAPSNLPQPQMKILPNGHRLIMSKPEHINPADASRCDAVQNNSVPCSGQQHFQSQKAFYDTSICSAWKTSLDISSTLANLGETNTNCPRLETMVITHNKLQDMLNKSIQSLVQLQKGLRDQSGNANKENATK